jgi:NADH-quinone oxidoreductase subunit N
MNAPQIWIFLPIAFAALLLALPSPRWRAVLASILSLGLTGLAALNAIDSGRTFWQFTLRIDSTFSLLGRRMVLDANDQAMLILMYAITALFFFGAASVGVSGKFAPAGLTLVALFIATLAVQPFLYAAFIFQIAALLAALMLQPGNQTPEAGVLRFLVIQTLAMPFILLAGFLLTGVEASPSDVGLVQQSALLLGLGFAFLLAIFPLNAWVPKLAEETHPYLYAFILLLLPITATIFGLGFLDRYAWLRNASQLPEILRAVGLILVATSGLWAAFQRHLGRMLAYTTIFQTGISLIALSLPDRVLALQIFFLLIPTRALTIIIWTMGLGVLSNQTNLTFQSVRGMVRQYPLAVVSITLAQLSAIGMPMLISFPGRQALWQSLGAVSLESALILGLATFGLLFGGLRALAVLVMADPEIRWQSSETPVQRSLFLVSWLLLVLPGIFPQWSQPFLASLPNIFDHLGK